MWRFQGGVLHQLPEDAFIYVFPGEDVSDHLLRGSFESAVRSLLKHVLRPGMVFLDAGTNLGLYMVIAAKLVGDSGRVFAFEPSQREWRRATRTLEVNHLKNVALFRLALTDRDGEVDLNVCEEQFGAFNCVGSISHAYAAGHESHVERVGGRALDSFLAEHQVRRVDVMKIDVEGAEEAVLRGGGCLFSGTEAPILILELSDWTARGTGSSAAAVWDLLVEYGYQLHSIAAHGRGYRFERCERRSRIEYEEVLAVKPVHMHRLQDVLSLSSTNAAV